MASFTLNQELNGIEISFNEIPSEDTRTALKKAGYRWHKVKKVWYAKQTADRLTLAESLAELDSVPTSTKTEIINLDKLGEKPEKFSYHSTDLSALIREDLKRRGVKGASVKAGRGGYTAHITVTVKATAADIVSIEEFKKRYAFRDFSRDAQSRYGAWNGEKWIYEAEWHTMSEDERTAAYNGHIDYYIRKAPDFNVYRHERNEYPTLTTSFYNKLCAIFRIANQWNYDNSDSMTDYFDVGYYLDVDIKMPKDFEPVEEMTEAERTAYDQEKADEEAERQAQIEKYRQEEAEREAAHKAYEAQRKIDREKIENNITVEDIPEADQIYITNLIGGIGKEATIDELRESEQGRTSRSDAVITRKVIFTDYETFELFGKYLLDDWSFLKDKGGTASEDVRLESYEDYVRLTQEQRDTIKAYMCDCIGVYVGDKLELVSNPEGYSYSRYSYELTAESEIINKQIELDRQRTESEKKTPFYFPAPVEEQAKNLHDGQQITVYQTDGWNLVSIYDSFGTILSVKSGEWAQYNGIWITYTNGKQTFIRDNKHCLIYEGIKPTLPDTLTREKVDDHMFKIYSSDELFPKVLEYYGKQGIKPLIDTIQR